MRVQFPTPMPTPDTESPAKTTGLRRELSSLHSYAALVGMLVGAGIFKVTSDASRATGAGVILGYLLLSPVILASSMAYVVFLSTSLGQRPGGDYTHVSEVFGSPRLAFVMAWLKLVSYLGAGAFLAGALADYTLELLKLLGVGIEWSGLHRSLSVGAILFFGAIHLRGVRWFGRVQVALCGLLGVSIVVLVLPGLLHLEPENLQRMFPRGASGFLESLPSLFFAYAGFEALAHSAGEVKDSSRQLPRVFVKGVLGSTLIFVSMSVVAFGVLPASVLEDSAAPMSTVASTYLPRGGSVLVTLGALAAVATSLNATLQVPARLALQVARDGLLPSPFAALDPRRKVPRLGVLLTIGIMMILVLVNQVMLLLIVAVHALIWNYFIHSAALLRMPRLRPDLEREVRVAAPRFLRTACGVVSMLCLGAIIAVIIRGDLATLSSGNPVERWKTGHWTSIELLVFWGGLGALLFRDRGPLTEEGAQVRGRSSP